MLNEYFHENSVMFYNPLAAFSRCWLIKPSKQRTRRHGCKLVLSLAKCCQRRSSPGACHWGQKFRNCLPLIYTHQNGRQWGGQAVTSHIPHVCCRRGLRGKISSSQRKGSSCNYCRENWEALWQAAPTGQGCSSWGWVHKGFLCPEHRHSWHHIDFTWLGKTCSTRIRVCKIQAMHKYLYGSV